MLPGELGRVDVESQGAAKRRYESEVRACMDYCLGSSILSGPEVVIIEIREEYDFLETVIAHEAFPQLFTEYLDAHDESVIHTKNSQKTIERLKDMECAVVWYSHEHRTLYFQECK